MAEELIDRKFNMAMDIVKELVETRNLTGYDINVY